MIGPEVLDRDLSNAAPAVLTLRSLSRVIEGKGKVTGAEADLAVGADPGTGRFRVLFIVLTDPGRTLSESSRVGSGLESSLESGVLSWIARMALRTKSAFDMCFDSSAICRSVLSMSMAAVTVCTTPEDPKTVVRLHS